MTGAEGNKTAGAIVDVVLVRKLYVTAVLEREAAGHEERKAAHPRESRCVCNVQPGAIGDDVHPGGARSDGKVQGGAQGYEIAAHEQTDEYGM